MRPAKLARIVIALLLIIIALVMGLNARSLYEGIFFYLRDMLAYDPSAIKPLNRDGRYASVYKLVDMRNTERQMFILNQVGTLRVTEFDIPGSSLCNIFVQFDSPGPYTIFSAHYDKLFDDANYQGASDNTAAVSVLLAAAKELGDCFVANCAPRNDNRAFLFTGDEETGLRGATAFIESARANKIAIREIINFDNIGRGNLSIRPSAPIPGFVFTIPILGDYAYDGKTIRLSPPYPSANERLAHALTRARPNITVYERFTATSDSNVFQANGIDTVAISGDNMYYLEQTWHTYDDKVELLDERNLDLAFELVMNHK